MAKVYITQNQPKFNFSKAAKFGDLTDVFPHDLQVYSSSPYIVDTARTRLSGCTPEDYLVMSGDPILIAVAFAEMAARNEGLVNVLKWDARENTYVPVVVDMGAQPT